jgi:hypothetical protein
LELGSSSAIDPTARVDDIRHPFVQGTFNTSLITSKYIYLYKKYIKILAKFI